MISRATRGRAAAALLTSALTALCLSGTPAAGGLPAAHGPRPAATAPPAAGPPPAPAVAAPSTTARTNPVDAEEPAEPLALDDVAPAVLDPEDDLTVTVTLTPTTDVEDGTLALALDPTIPLSRSVLAAWQSGEGPSGYASRTEVELDGTVAAGESRTVELEVPAEELGLVAGRDEWGPRGLEVVLTDAGEVEEVVRSVVVWGAPAESLEPLPVGLLVPATSGSVADPALVPGLGPGTAGAPDDPAPTGSEAPPASEAPTGGGSEPPTDGPPATETPSDRAAPGEVPSGEPPSDASTTTAPDAASGSGSTTDPGAASAQDAPSAVLTLAQAVAGTGASLALDPVLLDGAGSPSGTALTELAEDDRLLALPAGDADLAALAHLERPDLAQRLTNDGVDRIGMLTGHVVPSLAWPAGEEVDASTVELAHDGSTSVTVLPGPVLAPVADLTYTVSGRADVELGGARGLTAPALVAEERASSLLAGTLMPWSTGSPVELSAVQSRQLLLADLAVVFRERPSDPRPLLLTYDRSSPADPAVVGDVARALADAPWVDLLALGDLMDTPPASDEALSLPDRTVGPGEIDAAGLARAEETERLAAAVATMTDTPPPAVAGATLAVRTAVSAGWRDDAAGREALVTGWRDSLSAATHAVRPTPTSPINLIASTADLPVRVENEGDFDARVTVVVDPDDPRLEAPEGVEIVVPAGGQETALVPVSAIGSGDLPVRIRLVTPDGEQIGSAATIVVRVRAGWEGTAVTIAGVVLALLVVVGLARRIRRGVRVPTGDATPVIAGDPGAPTVHVTGEQPAVVDDGPRAGDGADRPEHPPRATSEDDDERNDER
ncbi:DUF6049 family protein [Georgenia sp. Z1491]|uniref:DUF6049 family protein n=1 Tax=Georgenia sp. Z1491 TaxID=3416707 RepID=UPI003CF0CF58